MIVKINYWAQGLAVMLQSESFFQLKLMLRGGSAFDKLMGCVPDFVCEEQAVLAIHSALASKLAKQRAGEAK